MLPLWERRKRRFLRREGGRRRGLLTDVDVCCRWRWIRLLGPAHGRWQLVQATLPRLLLLSPVVRAIGFMRGAGPLAIGYAEDDATIALAGQPLSGGGEPGLAGPALSNVPRKGKTRRLPDVSWPEPRWWPGQPRPGWRQFSPEPGAEPRPEPRRHGLTDRTRGAAAAINSSGSSSCST